MIGLLALAMAAAVHAPGCPAAARHPVGDPRRVYAVPGGCVWLLQPSATRAGTGPIVRVRMGGRTRTEPLSEGPLGDAYGVCGVTSFTVSGPYLTITATRAWLGQSAGCVPVRGGAMIWFERLRPDGYLHQLATSPPWRSG